LGSGLNYSGREERLQSRLLDNAEQPIGLDHNLSSADQEIQREINSVSNQIAEAEGDLRRAQQSARDLNSSIRTEERRLREEDNRT